MVWLLAAAAIYEVSRVLALEAVIGILQNNCKLIKLNLLNLIAVQAALKNCSSDKTSPIFRNSDQVFSLIMFKIILG